MRIIDIIKKKTEKPNTKIIAFFLILIILFGLFFCYMVYYNRIKPQHFNLDNFITDNSKEIAIITHVSNNDKYLNIEGQYLKDITYYKIFIAIKNEEGKMDIYRTEVKDRDQKVFYSLIKNDSLPKDSEINIIWMCNDENIIIKTGRLVGELDDE